MSLHEPATPALCPRCGRPSLVFVPACDLLTAIILTLSPASPTEPSFDLSETWQCRNPVCIRLSGIGRPRAAKAVEAGAGHRAMAV